MGASGFTAPDSRRNETLHTSSVEDGNDVDRSIGGLVQSMLG